LCFELLQEFFTFSLNLPKQLPEVVFDSATWWLDYVHKYAGRSPPYECCSIPSRRFRNWAKANQQQGALQSISTPKTIIQ
jgi:hypothetical protein